MHDAKRQAKHPGERKPPEPAAGFVEVFGGEGGGVGGSGNSRSVPAVWLGGLAGEPGFEVGEMISEVISHPPYRLVRGVDPRLLAFDGYLARAAVPPRPSFCQAQQVIHHAGHDVGGVPTVTSDPGSVMATVCCARLGPPGFAGSSCGPSSRASALALPPAIRVRRNLLC